MFLRTTSWIALSLFFISVSGTTILAETKIAKKTTSQPEKKPANIDGFRSAKFGMKEKDVFRAIGKDFKISRSKVERIVNSLEKTTSLGFNVEKLLEVGGPANINYILGFKSKKLVQINITWGNGIGLSSKKKVTPQRIVDTANFLRAHFVKKSYKKGSVVANHAMNENRTIVFRGSDKKNRMTLLTLSTINLPKNKDSKKVQTQVVLRLSYILDSENPDILTIGDNDF
jgi:hypothetical protein